MTGRPAFLVWLHCVLFLELRAQRGEVERSSALRPSQCPGKRPPSLGVGEAFPV
jgi:hypothetical protein